jgi:hypothetical protein
MNPPGDQEITADIQGKRLKRCRSASEPFVDLRLSHLLEVLLTVSLLVVAICQAWVYSRQAEIMDKQANISAQQANIMQAQVRPWVSGSNFVINGDLIHDPSGLQISLTADLKNSGQSVAQHTFFSFKPYLFFYPIDGIHAVCKDAEESHNILSIFPGEITSPGETRTIPEQDFVKLATDMRVNNRGKLPSVNQAIIFCIAYKSSWEKEFHHTPYIFNLVKADGKSDLLAEMMINPHTIPAAEVIIRQLPADLVGSAD